MVPSAVKNEGANNTVWQSDFRFFNPCGEDLDVRIEYQPGGVNNTGAVLLSRSFQMTADESRVFANIVEAIPALGEEELSGSVRIESESDSGCKVLTVSRTFNDTPFGTLGLFVPALPVKAAAGDLLEITGLIQNPYYRSNVRLVNFGDQDVWVRLKVIHRNGAVLNEGRSALVPGHSTRQVNNVGSWTGVGGNLSPFTIRIETGGADVEATATVVDNISGDSVLYQSSFLDENVIWVVGAAHNFGVNDSQWRTDLWLFNPTDDWLGGELEYVVGDSPGDRFGFQWPLLKTLSSREYLDIIGTLTGGWESAGYMILTGTGAKAGTLKTQALDFTWNPTSPGIGQAIRFDITGIGDDNVEADWDFGGAGCGNYEQVFNCLPIWSKCHEAGYEFSSSGAKTVSVTVRQGGSTLGTATHTVNVLSSGSCDGGGCSYAISPTSRRYSAYGGSGLFYVNTTAECAWNATTSTSWLNITSGSGTGPGSVSYNVAGNTGSTRAGTIRVVGKTHIVRQDPPGDEHGGPAPQVAARTYNLDATGGTYGLNLRAFGSNDLLAPGEIGYIAGISSSETKVDGFRTNLGLLNTDMDGWTGVAITLYRLDGSVLATKQLNIAPGVLRQFDVFKFLGVAGETMKASIKVEVLSGGGVAAYATEVDNRTQDSIFIPAQKVFMGAAR